jgi:outer membrane protein assembly factor BamB
MQRFCLPTVLTLLVGLSLSAADWPRFRGPNGTGVADGKLPAIDAKSPAWKVAIPGRGVSSPIVVHGKLFLQSASDDGNKRYVLCLDADTGKVLWERELPGKKAPTHAKNSLASSTPASDGERVYFVSWDGDQVSLLAYDMSGNHLWARTLGGYVSQHGVGASPAVYKGVVYVNLDEDSEYKGKQGDAVLSAFDAKTGELKWSADRKPHRACYSTPFLLEQPGKPDTLVLGTTTELTGYDPMTGKVLWAYAIPWPAGMMPLRIVGSPTYADGLIVCTFGDGGGKRYAAAIDPNGKTPTKVWDHRTGPIPYVPCTLVKDGLLFWVHDKGTANCIESKTGKLLWGENGERVALKDVTASPILAGDEILVIAEDGKYYVLRADREFEIIRKGDLGQPVAASPALVDGKLYVRGATHLFCFKSK